MCQNLVMPKYYASAKDALTLRIPGLVLTNKLKPISRKQYDSLSKRVDVHCIERAIAEEIQEALEQGKVKLEIFPKPEELQKHPSSLVSDEPMPSYSESLAHWLAHLPVDIRGSLSMTSRKSTILEAADCLGLSYDPEATKQELLGKISVKLHELETEAYEKDKAKADDTHDQGD